MKTGLRIAVILSVLGPSQQTLVAQGLAAVATPALTFSTSPRGNGMGGVEATLPSSDAAATIANPGHRRGEGTPFTLQAHRPDGSWQTVYEGKIYGTICGKACEPIVTDAVRLSANGAVVRIWSIRHPQLWSNALRK